LDPSKLEAHERAAVLKEVLCAYATALTCGAWDGGTTMPGNFTVRNDTTPKAEVSIINFQLAYIETMPVPAGKLVSPATTLDGEDMAEFCNTGWSPKELGDNILLDDLEVWLSQMCADDSDYVEYVEYVAPRGKANNSVNVTKATHMAGNETKSTCY
jgi:hypothetical protein